MADIDVDALLAPVNDTAPCGDDLEYDPAFLALEEAARGKIEQQFGDTLIAAQEPDWRAMREQSIALFARTRDLRVAIQLLRAATHLNGSSGFAAAIRVVHGLLERHWERVHPMLDTSDHNDATMRLNALAPLGATGAVLGDLRSAALGKAEPGAGESVPSAAGVEQALSNAAAQSPALLDELTGAHAAVRAIEALIDARAGAAEGPDLRALRAVTECMAQAAQQARGESVEAGNDAGGAPATAAPGAGSGAIGGRDDAIKALERVCEWIERHEPTNPAPLLIRRAQRLMTKSFIDIIRDLAPDGLKEVERIAGVDSA